MKDTKLIWLFFIGLLLFYLSWSPATTVGMGYTQETVDSANQMITVLGDWLRFRPASTAIAWPRNGFFEALFQMPLLVFSRVIFGTAPEWSNRFAALQPVVFSALTSTLILIWVRRLTGSAVWAYTLALVAALSTMLWPYAYIGIETPQAFFVLLAGYLALTTSGRRSWPRILIFAMVCGFALNAKSNGLFLIPVAVHLVWCYSRPKEGEALGRAKLVTVISIIAVCFLWGTYTRNHSPVWAQSSTMHHYLTSLADGPLEMMFNAWQIFTSSNKGLLVYCPVVLLGMIAARRTYRAHPRVTVFACLTMLCLIVCVAPLVYWSDETWGSRYFLTAIAPMIVCLGAAKSGSQFRWRRELPLILFAAWGFFVAFLGCFFYYGVANGVAQQTGHATLGELLHDKNWNPIKLHWELSKVWALRTPPDNAMWPPPPIWWFVKPDDAPEWKTADLHDYAIPQPLLVRGWSRELQGGDRFLWWLDVLALPSGICNLAWLAYGLKARGVKDRLTPSMTRYKVTSE